MIRYLVAVLLLLSILPFIMETSYSQSSSVTVKLTMIATDGHYPTSRFTVTYIDANDVQKEVRHHGNGLMIINNVKPNSLMTIQVKDSDQPPSDWNIFFWATQTARTAQFTTCSTGTCEYTFYYISNGAPSSGGGGGDNSTIRFRYGLIQFIDINYTKLVIEYLNKTQPVYGNITFYEHMGSNKTTFTNYHFSNTNNFQFNYTRSDITKSYWVYVTINNTTYNYFWAGKLSDIDKLRQFLSGLNTHLTGGRNIPLTIPLLVILLILGLALPSNTHIILSVLILVVTIFHNLTVITEFNDMLKGFLIIMAIALAIIAKYTR